MPQKLNLKFYVLILSKQHSQQQVLLYYIPARACTHFQNPNGTIQISIYMITYDSSLLLDSLSCHTSDRVSLIHLDGSVNLVVEVQAREEAHGS